jgi:hypothetical protein
MSCTSNYSEKRQHKCDVCGKRTESIRLDERDPLPPVPIGWYRIDMLSCDPTWKTVSVEACQACKTLPTWALIIRTLQEARA